MKMKLLFLSVAFMAVRLIAADVENPAPRLPRAQAVAPAGPMSFERVLTDEQRQKMREHMQEGGVRSDGQKIVQLRRELQEAVFSGKADEAFIKEKTDAIGKLEAEQLRIRMTALSKVAATFTPEQQKQIKEMTEQSRVARPGLRAGPRDGEAPVKREPAAPPPPEK